MPRQKQERGERLRPKSEKHRLYWKPGDPHALDVLDKEVQALDTEIPASITRLLALAQYTQDQLQAILAHEHYQESPTGPFTEADQQAFQKIKDRFWNRKHLKHLQTFFALLRRRRLLGRLRAIEATLHLANGLLAEEETLSQQFLTTLQSGQRKVESRASEPLKQLSTLRNKEEERVEGIEEPITPLITSAEQSRQLLTTFEHQLPELRSHLMAYSGWFEIFYVPKRHYKPEIVAYAEALKQAQKYSQPISDKVTQTIHPEVARLFQMGTHPKDMPRTLRDDIYNIIELGPYVRYRWRERKHIYTISLGLLDDYPPLPFIPAGF